MNNLNSPANFESSPIASPMAPNLNATLPMLGGRRKRHRKSKRSKKGGMFEPDTPEKDKGSRVSPLPEKTPLTDLMDDENSIENAKDDEYQDLEKEIIDDNKMDEDSYKIDIKEEEKINNDSQDILDKLERGVDVEARGGSRRRKRRSKNNKTKKLSKKTKKNKRKGSHNKKTRKTRRK